MGLTKESITTDKNIAEKLKLITSSVGCLVWVFCLILFCSGGGSSGGGIYFNSRDDLVSFFLTRD